MVCGKKGCPRERNLREIYTDTLQILQRHTIMFCLLSVFCVAFAYTTEYEQMGGEAQNFLGPRGVKYLNTGLLLPTAYFNSVILGDWKSLSQSQLQFGARSNKTEGVRSLRGHFVRFFFDRNAEDGTKTCTKIRPSRERTCLKTKSCKQASILLSFCMDFKSFRSVSIIITAVVLCYACDTTCYLSANSDSVCDFKYFGISITSTKSCHCYICELYM